MSNFFFKCWCQVTSIHNAQRGNQIYQDEHLIITIANVSMHKHGLYANIYNEKPLHILKIYGLKKV